MLVHVQLDGSERVMPLTELEEAVRVGLVGPETPVRAPVLTDDRWRPVGQLAFYQGLQDSPEARLRRRLADARIPWFTVAIVGVQLRLFLWVHATPVEPALIDRWAKYTPAIVELGQIERVVSYGFFHGSVGHVAMNLLFLAYVGAALERVVGSLHLAAIFFVSVAWGGAVSAALSTTLPSIGASAADFGYLAAAVVFGLRWFELLPTRERPVFGTAMLLYLLFGLLNGVVSDAPIDNWAHLAGLVAGGVHMALLRPDTGAAWRRRNRVVSGVALALAAAAAVAVTRMPVALVPVEEDGLVVSRPAWWDVGWSAVGESGWASPVSEAVVVARTTRSEQPTTAEVAAQALLADYRALDPDARVAEEHPVSADGVAGRALRIDYARAGTAREVRALVYARGRYTHRVALDAPVGTKRAEETGNRIFGTVKLSTPKAVAEARGAGDTWRGRLERARAAADVGDASDARTLLAAARSDAPGEPAVAEAMLAVEAAYPSATSVGVARELLAIFPADRRVRVGAVRALLAAGDAAAARAALDEGLVAAPRDRALGRLREELFPDRPDAQSEKTP